MTTNREDYRRKNRLRLCQLRRGPPGLNRRSMGDLQSMAEQMTSMAEYDTMAEWKTTTEQRQGTKQIQG